MCEVVTTVSVYIGTRKTILFSFLLCMCRYYTYNIGTPLGVLMDNGIRLYAHKAPVYILYTPSKKKKKIPIFFHFD